MKTVKTVSISQTDFRDEATTMALAVLVERIRSLPEDDKQDLFEVSKVLYKALAEKNKEEEEAAMRAYREILDQGKGRVVGMSVEDEPAGVDGWIAFVSRQIKAAREEAGMTQGDLEKATGLPQSHISRLENGVHSPSSSTLEKIAIATNKPVSFFDPCTDRE